MHNFWNELAIDGNNTTVEKEIIKHLLYSGECTCSELSKEIKLSTPTTTKLISKLITLGFIIETGKSENAQGRKPILYGVNPEAGHFIGVDVNYDHIQIGTMDFKGKVVNNEQKFPYWAKNSTESIDTLCNIINNYIESLSIERDKIMSIGINLSGRVNATKGYSYSYFNTENLPLTQLIKDRLHCHVTIENDTRAMCYGEYMMGVCENQKNIVYINAGWGLGIGMIINGELYYGKSGFSGEFGHFPYYNNDILCSCGKSGCIETEASGSAVHRRFIEKLNQNRVSILSKKYNSTGEITLSDIIESIRKEDSLAIEVIEEVAEHLGKSIAGLINIFNPELIVIGGSLAAAGRYLQLGVESAIYKHSLRLVNEDTEIKVSSLGKNAGIIGACLLTRSKILNIVKTDKN